MEQASMNEQGMIHIPEDQGKSSNPNHRLGISAFVCGIIAVTLNLFAVTAVVGIILSILSIVFGANSYKNSSYGKAGLVLGLLSLFIIVVYVVSTIVVVVADPFL